MDHTRGCDQKVRSVANAPPDRAARIGRTDRTGRITEGRPHWSAPYLFTCRPLDPVVGQLLQLFGLAGGLFDGGGQLL